MDISTANYRANVLKRLVTILIFQGYLFENAFILFFEAFRTNFAKDMNLSDSRNGEATFLINSLSINATYKNETQLCFITSCIHAPAHTKTQTQTFS